MTAFTASNGYTVEYEEDRHIRFGPLPTAPIFLHEEEELALREFFRAEEDRRLGRWRFNENLLVYPEESRGKYFTARVVRETDGLSCRYQSDGRETDLYPELFLAFRAYVDAHPEQPWHDAKPGETWVLKVSGIRMSLTVDSHGEFQGLVTLSPRSTSITAGRRIWPEVTS